jgi:hypothetical protein
LLRAARRTNTAPDVDGIVDIFSRWLLQGIEPTLTNAGASDSQLTSKLWELGDWDNTFLSLPLPTFNSVDLRLGTIHYDAAHEAATAILSRLSKVNTACTTGNDLEFAKKVLYWHRTAALLFSELVGPFKTDRLEAEALDLDATLKNLCVKIVFEPEPTFPKTLDAGQAGTLVARAGYKIGTNPVRYDEEMDWTVHPHFATDNTQRGGPLNDGQHSTFGGNWTRASSNNPLLLTLVAGFSDTELHEVFAQMDISAGSTPGGLAGLVGYEFTGWWNSYRDGVLANPPFSNPKRWSIVREGSGFVMNVFNADSFGTLFTSGPIVELTATHFQWTTNVENNIVWDVTNDANGFRATFSRSYPGPPAYTGMTELTNN